MESFIEIEYFGSDVTTIEELTDEFVKSKLEEVTASKKDVSYDDALSLVKSNIRLDANESDARNRIILLNAAYVTLSRKHGWSFKKDAPKAAIRHLLSVLQPPVLKKKVEEAVELDVNGIKYDYKKFISFLMDKAAVCEEFNPLREYLKSKSKEQGKQTGKKNEDKKNETSSGPGNPSKNTTPKPGASTTPGTPKNNLPPGVKNITLLEITRE